MSANASKFKKADGLTDGNQLKNTTVLWAIVFRVK